MISVSKKEGPGRWWTDTTIPIELIDDVGAMLQEAKLRLRPEPDPNETDPNLRRLEFDRGKADALAGHPPAVFAGPYVEGYVTHKR